MEGALIYTITLLQDNKTCISMQLNYELQPLIPFPQPHSPLGKSCQWAKIAFVDKLRTYDRGILSQIMNRHVVALVRLFYAVRDFASRVVHGSVFHIRQSKVCTCHDWTCNPLSDTLKIKCGKRPQTKLTSTPRQVLHSCIISKSTVSCQELLCGRRG